MSVNHVVLGTGAIGRAVAEELVSLKEKFVASFQRPRLLLIKRGVYESLRHAEGISLVPGVWTRRWASEHFIRCCVANLRN
jgi:hypothetical protein